MGKKQAKELTKEEKAERNRKRLENYNPVMAARNALRREFSRSPIVIEMMKDPATSRTYIRYKKNGEPMKQLGREHLCSKCNKWKRSSKGKKVAIDHINPVIDPNAGYVDMNTYFLRLWVPREELQKLCGDCHQEKTNAEWFNRRFKEELIILTKAEMVDKIEAKKLLKRFTPKKWASGLYPKEFIKKVESLKARLRSQ